MSPGKSLLGLLRAHSRGLETSSSSSQGVPSSCAESGRGCAIQVPTRSLGDVSENDRRQALLASSLHSVEGRSPAVPASCLEVSQLGAPPSPPLPSTSQSTACLEAGQTVRFTRVTGALPAAVSQPSGRQQCPGAATPGFAVTSSGSPSGETVGSSASRDATRQSDAASGTARQSDPTPLLQYGAARTSTSVHVQSTPLYSSITSVDSPSVLPHRSSAPRALGAVEKLHSPVQAHVNGLPGGGTGLEERSFGSGGEQSLHTSSGNPCSTPAVLYRSDDSSNPLLGSASMSSTTRALLTVLGPSRKRGGPTVRGGVPVAAGHASGGNERSSSASPVNAEASAVSRCDKLGAVDGSQVFSRIPDRRSSEGGADYSESTGNSYSCPGSADTGESRRVPCTSVASPGAGLACTSAETVPGAAVSSLVYASSSQALQTGFVPAMSSGTEFLQANPCGAVEHSQARSDVPRQSRSSAFQDRRGDGGNTNAEDCREAGANDSRKNAVSCGSTLSSEREKAIAIKERCKDVELLDEALLDCYGRFITILPDSLLRDRIHLYFQIQEAFWWYDDIWWEKHAERLPKLTLKDFGCLICYDCPILQHFIPPEKHDKFLANWKRYCRTIPLRGAIILNEDLSKCLMVTGWNGGSWMFPRGKVDELEEDAVCACREIWEEIGVDISPYIDDEVFVEDMLEEQPIKLFIIPGIKETVNFQPLKRKEIGRIGWIDTSCLPGWHRSALPRSSKPGVSDSQKLRTWQVEPFVPALRGWIDLLRQAGRKKVTVASSLQYASLSEKGGFASLSSTTCIAAFSYQVAPGVPRSVIESLQEAAAARAAETPASPPRAAGPVPSSNQLLQSCGHSMSSFQPATSHGGRAPQKQIGTLPWPAASPTSCTGTGPAHLVQDLKGSFEDKTVTGLARPAHGVPSNVIQDSLLSSTLRNERESQGRKSDPAGRSRSTRAFPGFQVLGGTQVAGCVVGTGPREVGLGSSDDQDLELRQQRAIENRETTVSSINFCASMQGQGRDLSATQVVGGVGRAPVLSSNEQRTPHFAGGPGGRRRARERGISVTSKHGKGYANMMGNNQVASVDDSGVTYHSKGGRQRAGQQGVGCKKGGRVWGKDRCNNTTFGGGHGSGWSVEEMFRYNEEIFGVVSTYDIETYTVPLPKRPGNGRGTRDTGSSLKPGSDTHKKERKGDASQGADTVPSPAHNVTTETRLNTRRSSCVLPRGADGEIGTSDPMRGNGSNPSGHSLLLAREGEPIVASGSTDAGSPSAIRSGPTKAEAATAGEGCTDKKLPNCKPVGGFVAETSSNASVTLMGLLKRGISSNGKQSPDGASPPSKTGAVTVAAPQPVDQSSTCGLSFSEAPVPKFESCGAGKCASFDFGAFLQKVKQQQDRRIGSQSADKSQTLVRVEGTGKLVREAGAHGNSEDSAIRESVSRAMRQLARFPAVGAGEAVPSQRSCTSAQQKSEQRDLTPSTSPRGALSSSSPPTPSAISPPEYLDAKQRQRQCAGGFPGADGRERGGGFGDRGVTSPPPAPYMHATESPGYVSECPTLGQAAGGSEASYPSFEQLEDLGGDDGYAEGSRGRSTSRTSAKSVQSVSLSEGRAGGTDSGKTGIPESTKKTKGGLRVVREQEVVGCATMRENDLKWQGEWTGDRRTTAAPCEPCRNAGASDRASEKGKERLDRSSLSRRITGQQMTKFDSGSSGPGTSQKEMKGRRRRESVSSCTAEALDSLQRRDVKAGGAIENILSGGEGFDDEALSDQTILGRLRRLSHDASTLAEQGSEGRDSAVHFGRPRCAAKADSHSKAPESGRKKESCSVARDPQQSTGARSLQGRKEQPLASAVNENAMMETFSMWLSKDCTR